MLHRRGFLTGMFSAFAAPAIVRASSLMPVKAMPPYMFPVNATVLEDLLKARMDDVCRVTREVLVQCLYSNPDNAPDFFSGHWVYGGLTDLS